MKIGIISDTHDNYEAIKIAVKIFNDERVDLVLHCGDHVSPFTVRWLGKLNTKLIGVKGNLDAEFKILSDEYSRRNWEIHKHSKKLDINGRRIIFLHGEDENLIEALLKSNLYDIVVRGHLHRVINRWMGNTLHLSSGEACGYLTGKRTIAILKLPEINVEIIKI